jgi:hypothetical protein
MPSRNWSDDDELMQDLAAALRPTPVEPRMIDAARAAFAWRTVDADLELATLLYDSHLDGSAAVRGPAPGAPRALVFRSGRLGVEIELSDAGIEGQLIPPEPGVVRLLTVAGAQAETTADEVGCFTFAHRRRGPIRIEGVLATGTFATQWIAG